MFWEGVNVYWLLSEIFCSTDRALLASGAGLGASASSDIESTLMETSGGDMGEVGEVGEVGVDPILRAESTIICG